MSKSKQKGTAFETATVNYLLEHDAPARREVLHGARDIGDIGGVELAGRPLVLECKNYARANRMAQWLAEAVAERDNAVKALACRGWVSSW